MRLRVRSGVLPGVLVAILAIGPVLPDQALAIVELRDAQERRVALEELLATTAGDLEAREEQIVEGEHEIAGLASRDDELVRELADVERGIALRARTAFMTGGATTFQAILQGQDPGAAVERAALLGALALGDTGTMEAAAALRTELAQTRALRAARLVELEGLRTELEADVALLNDELEAAAGEIRFLELKARRQREVDNGFMSGIYSCPVGDPVFFANTWGNARSGGRSHKGVDMMAPHGTPIYAIHDGRVTRMKSGGLGGIVLYMYGSDGNQYYYAHLQGYASGVGVGSWVEAGDLLGYNGDTGNARGGAPHLHFEVHPGGGRAVNPYPYTAAACGR